MQTTLSRAAHVHPVVPANRNDGVRRRDAALAVQRNWSIQAELFVGTREHVSVGIVYGSIGDALLDEESSRKRHAIDRWRRPACVGRHRPRRLLFSHGELQLEAGVPVRTLQPLFHPTITQSKLAIARFATSNDNPGSTCRIAYSANDGGSMPAHSKATVDCCSLSRLDQSAAWLQVKSTILTKRLKAHAKLTAVAFVAAPRAVQVVRYPKQCPQYAETGLMTACTDADSTSRTYRI